MNTELMVKIQNLIYSNQENLDKVLSVLEEGLIEKTLDDPEKPYTVSGKDVGSLCCFLDYENEENAFVDFLTKADDKFGYKYDSNGDPWCWCKPYTDPIKLHFKPFVATEDSVKPNDCGNKFAVLWNDGDIRVYRDSDPVDFKRTSYSTLCIAGYCPLTFVNPILDK